MADQTRTRSPAGARPPSGGSDGLHPLPPLLGGHRPGPRGGDPSEMGRGPQAGSRAELRLADERALIQGDVATLVPPRDAAEPAPASRDDVSLISAQVRAGLMPTAVDMHAQGARVVSGLISGDGPLNVRVCPQVTVTAGEARICSVHASPAAGRRMVERYGRLSAARSPQ
jgi:hypothetical protein